MAISQHHVLVNVLSLSPSLSLWQIKYPHDRTYQSACNCQYSFKILQNNFFLFPANKIDIAAEIVQNAHLANKTGIIINFYLFSEERGAGLMRNFMLCIQNKSHLIFLVLLEDSTDF